MTDAAAPWYSEGLRFACSGCGACCRVEGHVWVDEPAARRLAALLDLTLDEFGRRYLRRVGRRYSLVEKPNQDCVFWDDGCGVYEARPPQCRTFPFWAECIDSEEAWAETAAECRGIGRGRLYGRRQIEALAAGDATTPSGPAPGGDCGCSASDSGTDGDDGKIRGER